MVNSILGPAQTAVLKGAQTSADQMEKVQVAMATGRKNDSYGELGTRSGSFSAAEFSHALAESEGFNVLLTQPVLNGSQSLAGALTNLANQGYTLATQLKNGGLPNFDVQGYSDTLLNQSLDMMNTRIGGLSISSGTRSDQTAWDKTNLQNPATYTHSAADDVAMPQGYQGDSTPLTLVMGEKTHKISFTGNELGPQRLVRAFHILANANKAIDGDALYTQKINEVVRVFGQAKDDMRNIEARLSLEATHIEHARVSAKQKEFKNTDLMQELNGTDNLETIPVLMALATHLRTSYSVMAKDGELTRELTSVLSQM